MLLLTEWYQVQSIEIVILQVHAILALSTTVNSHIQLSLQVNAGICFIEFYILCVRKQTE